MPVNPSVIELSSLNGTTGFQISGEAAYDSSGRSVSCAGDVNGDGFADLIIGANGADPNGVSSGASYVVFGKASGFAANLDLSSLDGSTGFQINGEAVADYSGFSVSGAGDVNGDGFADLIIGAYRADPNGNYSGASYVVFGKASGFAANLNLSSLNGSTGFQINGEAVNDYSGRSVSGAGDVNGDGFADLIVGASGANPNGYASGASYVIFGRATGTLNRTFTDAAEVIGGGDWDDTLNGAGGNDTMSAGAGDDLINGGTGDDTADGGTGDDEMIGGSGDDKLSGGSGNDLIKGGSGNDTLTGSTGADDLRGGSGNDIYNVDAFDTVIEAAGSGTDTIRSAATYSIAGLGNIERLTLTGTAAANGTGNGLANILTGNTAVNTLNGGAGADQLIGGKGRDTLTGGTESDSFRFSAGDSGQTAATMDIITDFAKGAIGVGDRFDFASALAIGGSAAAATANEASINQTTGVASFNAGSGTTMADALSDIANRFTVSANSAGEFALFRVNNTGAFHVFVSDGVAGVGANDVVVQLTAITGIGSIDLTAGDLTILT